MPHADPEARRRYAREYRRKRAKDPLWREKMAAQARARHLADPTKRRETERRYAERHPERVSARHRAWRDRNALRQAIYGYRARGWQIDERLLVDLVTDNCFYCGATPDPVNGVDRVDSARGYEEDNVVTACRQCNVAKLDQSVDEFSAWLDRIEAHRHGVGAWH